MNKTIITCIFILFITQLGFGQEKSFVYTGNPLVRDIYTADPSAHVWEDGRLYVYPSQDVYPSRGCDLMDKYHVYSTDDMVNWIDHGEILKAADVPWGEALENGATFMWAPDCAYKNGKYYFYFPHPNKNPWGNNWKTGIAVSDKPASDFVCLNYWLKGVPDFGYIDPCVFIDNDGQAYFYYGGSQRCFGAKMKDSMDEIDGELIEMTSGLSGFHEGPWIFRRNDIYYLMYPAGAGSKDGDEMRYATSENPLGPWKYKGVVLKPTGCGTSHGSIVEFKGQWYIFYHNQMLSNDGTLRSICFDKLYFNEDGTIQTVTQTQDVGQPYKGIMHTAPGTIEAEDFNSGGQPFAYKDNTSVNMSEQYRPAEAVDINSSRRSGITYVTETESGEYINYTFEVLEEGIYEIDFVIGSAIRDKEERFYLEFDFKTSTNPRRYSTSYASVDKLPTVTVPNISLEKGIHVMKFIPQGNLNFDKFTFRKVKGSSIESTKKDELMVYPSLSEGIFRIKTTEKGFVRVSSLNGQTVLKEEINDYEHEINLSGQSPGIYILGFETRNQVINRKIIKK